MGTVTDHHGGPRESTEKNTRREERKMCHPSQTSPNPNQAWQGVYPDLSAFNDLFSPQAAPQPNPQPSPWISFLGSLGLQPIPQEQHHQRQGSAQEQPSAPPAPEQEPAGETFAGSNVYSQRQPPQPGSNQPGHQGSNTQSPPGGAQGCHQNSSNPRRSAQSCNFSSVATRASVTFFCAIAFFCILSSLPGFLIHSALYLVLATSLLGLPLPALLAGHVLYSVVTFLHPLCALVLLLPCLHKLHVRRLPLANPANWGPRFTGGNAAWTHHQHQAHQHQQ